MSLDEEILDILRKGENRDIIDITWDEIVRRGADKNYNGKSDFEKSQKDYIERSLDFWKSMNIKSKIDYVKALRKNIDKLKSKKI